MKSETTQAASRCTEQRIVGASSPHNVLVSGTDENGSMVDLELRLYDLTITVNGHCKIYSPNDNISGGNPSAESDCSAEDNSSKTVLYERRYRQELWE